jgi:hypothetical protein
MLEWAAGRGQSYASRSPAGVWARAARSRVVASQARADAAVGDEPVLLCCECQCRRRQMPVTPARFGSSLQQGAHTLTERDGAMEPMDENACAETEALTWYRP